MSTTAVRTQVQRIVARLKSPRTGHHVPAEADLAGDQSGALPELIDRDAVHRLDSPESVMRLRRHGLTVSSEQCALFHALQTRWEAQVIAQETGRCIVENRFNQEALDGYFTALEAVHALGPTASMRLIAAVLGRMFPRRAVLLYVAVVCGMFSDALADETWEQMRQFGDPLDEDELVREAVATYLASRDARLAIALTKQPRSR